MPMSKTERNLWSAFLGEAKANRTYVAYGIKGLEEGLPEVAAVFMEAAGAETVHGLSHFRVLGEMGPTLETLRKVVGEEAYEMETMYPRMIEEALAENRPDAAKTFRLALEGERHHLQIFRQALKDLERKLDKKASARQPQRAAVASEASDGATAATVELPSPPSAEPGTSEVYTEKGRIEALSRIREVIFGMQDGLVTTATLGAAVASATTGNHTVIIAGLAAALGGTFSMAGGAFLGSRAEREVQEAEMSREAREIEQHPAEELAELIEIYRLEGFPYDEAVTMAENVASDRQRWPATLAEKELGLPAEIIASPLKDAAAMAGAFAIGGMLPLIPYFIGSGGETIIASVAIAVVSLFAMGVAKSRLVRRNPIISGLEVAVIGSVVAAIGYLLGSAFPAS